MAERLMKSKEQKHMSGAKDRITNLPDSLVHQILSLLPTKNIASTCVLSKRWNYLWICFPILDFMESISQTSTSSEIQKLMGFVERTLLLRDRGSNIQKFSLKCRKYMGASRVNSCISSVVKFNVEEVSLHLCQITPSPFIIPVSLFSCESLVSLELRETGITRSIRFPKYICLPKLKCFTLYEITFTGKCSNELVLTNCRMLEKLNLIECTFPVSVFCISAPWLKKLVINGDKAGIQGCTLKIHAPNLVSLDYQSNVAKDYVLSTFVAPVKANLLFYLTEYEAMEQKINQIAAVRRFLGAVSHVKCLSMINPILGGALSVSEHLLNKLPTFRNLNRLELYHVVCEESVIALLKASPYLESLVFNLFIDDTNDAEGDGDVEGLHTSFGHLKSVRFMGHDVNPMELRWIKLILKNAVALQNMTLSYLLENVERQEEFMEEIYSVPRASSSCMLNFSLRLRKKSVLKIKA